jgi:threonine/homoserine/homoserine lactone efflux protein
MEIKTKKNAAIALILIGLITLASQVDKYLNEELRIARIVVIVCAAVLIICGLISLRNVNKAKT